MFITLEKRINMTIDRLKNFEPPEGYYLAFSGGKDSIVIKQLAIESGVKFDSYYSVTTIDPPDLIYYIRKYHKDVIWDRPKEPFLSMLVKKGFPLRQARWCCELYKERCGSNRLVVTGIRAEESRNRKSRKMTEVCFKDSTKRFLHAIIDWDAQEVWAFIRDRKLPYCTLYDEGWHRIGCLFCPMKNEKHKSVEIEKYPAYKKAFMESFKKLYQDRKSKGKKSVDRWKDGEEMFWWWISGKGFAKENKRQIGFFDN